MHGCACRRTHHDDSSVDYRKGESSFDALCGHVDDFAVVGPDAKELAQALEKVFLVPKVRLLSKPVTKRSEGVGRSPGRVTTPTTSDMCVDSALPDLGMDLATSLQEVPRS